MHSKRKKQRKPPTLKERMTPCVVCLHPLSQKHHLLSFSTYGDKGAGTIQLCANSHDLYHLFERYARKLQREGTTKLFDVQSQEEKLIESIGSRPQYRPLVRLAGIVRLLDKMMSQDETEENKDGILNCLTFIANFKQYVEEERKKRDDWFKENGKLVFSVFGGDNE